MRVRVIPRLDIKSQNLVKGIHLEGLRVLGSPEEFARHYYLSGADELLYMDIVASLYERENILGIVERTSREIFIPLTVGGGIRSIDDIRAVLRAGADKVAINTAAIQRPEFITEAATKFGSSTIVVSIEAKKQSHGGYEAYTDNGRERTGVEVMEWARRACALGAGEIMITSIDQEGTGRGYDVALVKAITDTVDVPVIACGGAGSVEHVADCVTKGRADAVCISSLVHYDLVASKAGVNNGSGPRALGTRFAYSRVKPASIATIKRHLTASGIDCRGDHAELS